MFILTFIMYLTARDVAEASFPKLTQSGVSLALGYDSLLSIINNAANMTWNHNLWSWTMWRDAFLTTNTYPVRLVTSFPVARIYGFYTGTMRERDKTTSNPFCDCDVPEDFCKPLHPCSCEGVCGKLKLTEVMPQDELCENTYQIAGSEIQGVGGVGGTVVRAKISQINVGDALWMSYFRDFKPAKKFDDNLGIPYKFISILAELVKYLAAPSYLQFRAGEEVNARQIANTLLDSYARKDGPVREKMDFSGDVYNRFNK